MFDFLRKTPARKMAEAAGSEEQQFLAQFDDALVVEEGSSPPADAINQVAFIGRNPEKSSPAANIFGRLPSRNRAQDTCFKVICFYTIDNEYCDLANGCKRP